MAENGVTTTGLPQAPLVDGVIGNRDGTTVQQPVLDLAAQLAASGLIGETLANIPVLQATTTDLDGRVAAVEGIATTGAVPKASVATVALTDITLSGVQSVSGLASDAADALDKGILVVGQSDPAQNGVYIPGAGAWTRRTDLDAAAEFAKASVRVDGGTYAGRTYWQTATVTTLGTDAVVWSMIADDSALFAGKIAYADGAAKLDYSRTLWGGQKASLISRNNDGELLLSLALWSIRDAFAKAEADGLLPDVAVIESILTRASGATPGRYADGLMLWGLDNQGRFDAVQPSQRFADMIGALLGDLGGGSSYDPIADKLLPTRDLSFVGDSMMSSTLAAAVQSYLGDGRTRTLQQKGGLTAANMCVVIGRDPLTISVSGGSIPGDGSAVAVTSRSFNILQSGGVYSGTARVYFEGPGITQTCLIETDSSGNWTIKREVAGAAITVADGTQAILHPTIGTSFIPSTEPPRSNVRIIRAGRNGSKGTHAQRMAQRDAVLRLIDYADSRQQHTLFLSIYNQSSTNEPSGSAGYDAIMETNRLIAEAVGAQIYVDMRGAAVATAIYELGDYVDDTTNAADLSDMAVDCIPSRYFSDSTHMTSTFQTSWEAPFISRSIIARGY